MKVVSLFSGAGGFDLGFLQAGHKIIWANDNDPDAVATYRRNLGEHIVVGDICKIPSRKIPACDIVIGGFPCQGFSVANVKRHENDKRNALYLQLLRVIKDKQPAVFVAENVKGLLSLGKGRILEAIIGDFRKVGYRVSYRVLNAADYGVPQKRERLLIVGTRQDMPSFVDFPEPTHADPSTIFGQVLRPWVTIGEALAGIAEPDANSSIPNHTYSKYKLRFNGYLGHRMIDPNKPAPTVTARGDDRGGVVVLHHPKNHRRMSVRELALTQAFPMDFVFECNQSSAYRLIGNAVPPLLSVAIARAIPLKVPTLLVAA